MVPLASFFLYLAIKQIYPLSENGFVELGTYLKMIIFSKRLKNSICLKDRILTVTTTPSQSEPGSHGKDIVLDIP